MDLDKDDITILFSQSYRCQLKRIIDKEFRSACIITGAYDRAILALTIDFMIKMSVKLDLDNTNALIKMKHHLKNHIVKDKNDVLEWCLDFYRILNGDIDQDRIMGVYKKHIDTLDQSNINLIAYFWFDTDGAIQDLFRSILPYSWGPEKSCIRVKGKYSRDEFDQLVKGKWQIMIDEGYKRFSVDEFLAKVEYTQEWNYKGPSED